MNMCEVLDRVESRGMARGEARGKILGVQSTLISLVKKNLLSIRDAASEAGMSDEPLRSWQDLCEKILGHCLIS